MTIHILDFIHSGEPIRNTHIPPNNQAQISITAPAAKSIHRRASQIKSCHCKKHIVNKNHNTKPEQITANFIHTCIDTLYVLLQSSSAHLLLVQIRRLLLACLKELHHLSAHLRPQTEVQWQNQVYLNAHKSVLITFVYQLQSMWI